jgi:hypothetical protein
MAKKEKYPYKAYPILGYRVTKVICDEIVSQIEKILKLWNSQLEAHEKLYKKNDIFIKALKRGLNQLESEKKK